MSEAPRGVMSEVFQRRSLNVMTAQRPVEVQAEEHVRLLRDVPELGLQRGDVGRVCSTWFDPNTAFEVEFDRGVASAPLRALLGPDQIQVEARASH
jgi:hypothetical protein